MTERFKVKVSQEDYDSTRTPFWTPRMIDILMAVYRWPLVVGGLVLMVLAATWLGTVYWAVFSLLAMVLLRRSPGEWLRPLIAPPSKKIREWWDQW